MNKKELRDLAEVTAAALYADMADHFEGERTVKLMAGVSPVGNVGAVVQPNLKRMIAYSSIGHRRYYL